MKRMNSKKYTLQSYNLLVLYMIMHKALVRRKISLVRRDHDHHLGLVMGKKPEGDKGNSPGESGGCGPGPKIPDCAKGDKGKWGVKGDGN